MTTPSSKQIEPTLAATVAPEDVACGDYVAPLSQTYEVPSYLWDGSSVSLAPHELVRLTMIPPAAGVPHKVVAVCLPFVYATAPRGETVTLDVRRTQLVRLDRRAAKIAWKRLRVRENANLCD